MASFAEELALYITPWPCFSALNPHSRGTYSDGVLVSTVPSLVGLRYFIKSIVIDKPERIILEPELTLTPALVIPLNVNDRFLT